MWRRVAAVAGDELRMLCPDTRGIGRSGWPRDGDFNKDRIADDALALLDALGLEQVTVAGHDWGGYVATLLALRAPERVSRVVILSVPHPWQPASRVLLNGWRFAYIPPLAAPVLGPRLAGKLAMVALRGGWGDRGTWDEGMAREFAAMTARSGAASSLLYRHFLLRELTRGFRGRRLAMPATLLMGDRDPLGTAWTDGFERRVDAEAHVEILEGAGHFLPEERPERVADALRG
jgi:pimeloyl-ACP methyl ester carboxylesterase